MPRKLTTVAINIVVVERRVSESVMETGKVSATVTLVKLSSLYVYEGTNVHGLFACFRSSGVSGLAIKW